MGDIGYQIKKIREEKSLNQYELARSANISQSFLSELENGHKCPTIKTVKKIAEALKVSPNIILDPYFKGQDD